MPVHCLVFSIQHIRYLQVISNGLLLDLPLPAAFPGLQTPAAVVLFDVSIQVLDPRSHKEVARE